MEPAQAAQHLQVIRTLMERSALYRRALAPIMICSGALGLVAALLGCYLRVYSSTGFILFWYAVGAVAVAAALLLTRRQALKQGEAFWSPPTRRVVQAMLPPMTAGFLLGVSVLAALFEWRGSSSPAVFHPRWLALVALPCLWTVLYGCAMHAAGFYTTRGMRWFGWCLCVLGCAALWLSGRPGLQPEVAGHALMGFVFGASHLAYGVYLYFTEPRRTEP